MGVRDRLRLVALGMTGTRRPDAYTYARRLRTWSRLPVRVAVAYPVSCPYCIRRFANAGGLARHLTGAHLRCPRCLTLFVSRRGVATHRRQTTSACYKKAA